MDQQQKDLFDLVIKHIDTKNINNNSIMVLLTQAMTLAKNINQTGENKKMMVLNVAKTTVTNFTSGDLQAGLLIFIDVFGPTFIDTLYWSQKQSMKVIKSSGCCI